MPFVGRQRETRVILGRLGSGTGGGHLVVTGRFEIGRTRLLRHVATVARHRWRFAFVDFFRPPAQASHQLLDALSAPPAAPANRAYTHYRVSRYRLSHLEPGSGPPPVAVLDDIQRVTGPRLRFLRELAAGGWLRLIAVVDDSVPAADLLRLRGALHAAPVLALGRLPASCCAQFFASCSRQWGLGWPASRIAALSQATGGYPLGMLDAALRASGRTGPIAAPGRAS